MSNYLNIFNCIYNNKDTIITSWLQVAHDLYLVSVKFVFITLELKSLYLVPCYVF